IKLDDIGIVWGDSKDNGLIVKNLAIDGKAGKLGIEKGETIAYVNNQPVKTAQDYERIVNETIAKGEEIRFTIADDDKYKTVSVSVPDVEIAQIQEQLDKEKSSEANKDKPIVKEFKKEAKKGPQAKQQADQKPQIPIGDVIQIAILGITVQALPNGTEGVIITDLRPQSPAVEAGLRLGQIIFFVVNEKKVENVEQFKQFVRDGLDDGKVTITAINKTAISKLIEVLQNKGLIVRFDAAIALGELRDKAAVDSLINMLQEETNPIEIKL
ncbi:MAG: hypothetical protein AAB116_00845, partial [Candidatus Poribacteria bacterium]